MDRTTAAGYITVDGKRVYQDRDRPNGIAGTSLIAADRTAVQEELINLITGAGLTPDADDLTQVFKAVSQIATGSESAFLPISGGTLTGIVIGIAVSDWSRRELVNALDADGRYVKKAGDTSTGSQYSSGWFSGGINGGWNGARANTGDYGWTNGLEFGNPAKDGKYRGTWSVTDVLNEGSSNSSGLNLTGYDSAGKTYQWYFSWNGNITTPKGLVAFQSDLSGYIANINIGISGAISGTSLCVNPSDGRAYFAYSGNTQIAALAWSADVTAETTARVNADNNLQAQVSAKLDSSFVASGLFDGSQGSTTSGTIVGGTWMRVGNTLTQNLVIENIGGGTVTFPFPFSGNANQVTVIVQDGTGSNNSYTTGSITTTGTGIHASGGGGTGRLHLTVSGPFGT